MFILHQQWFYIFRWWQMPLAATNLSGISAFHFQNCRSFLSLDKLWFFLVKTASFKYGLAVEFETLGTLFTLQESSFYSYPLLQFCFSSLDPCFLLPLSCSLVYPCIWLFKNSSASPWNPKYFQKDDLLERKLNFRKLFFSVLWTHSCPQLRFQWT